MAGNKPTRKPHKPTKPNAPTRTVHLPMLHLPPSQQILRDAAANIKKNLNKLITGEATETDWFNVVFRLNAGNIAAFHFMKYPYEMDVCFMNSFVMAQLIKMRQLDTGEWGVMVREVDCIVRALDVTERIMRELTLDENLKVHRATDKLFKDMVSKNIEQYPESALNEIIQAPENAEMVKTLMQEMAIVAANDQKETLSTEKIA